MARATAVAVYALLKVGVDIMPRKAKGRMLWGQISVSPRVNKLSLKACLLYTWLIAHADDQGRMLADTNSIKGTVCPLRQDISEDDIATLLGEIEEQGLIIRYNTQVRMGDKHKSAMVLQLVDWWEYQWLTKPRPSEFPPADEWTDRLPRTFNRFKEVGG